LMELIYTLPLTAATNRSQIDMSLYTVLECTPQSTKAELKANYKRLAMQFHPDRQGGDEKVFKEISEAYEILRNAKKRDHYDTTGEIPPNSQIESEALQALAQIFIKIATQKNWQNYQYVRLIRVDLEETVTSLKLEKAKHEGLIERLQAMILPDSDEPENLFQATIVQQQDFVKARLMKIDQNLNIGEEALRLLKGYHDQTPPEELGFQRAAATPATGQASFYTQTQDYEDSIRKGRFSFPP